MSRLAFIHNSSVLIKAKRESMPANYSNNSKKSFFPGI